MADSGRRSVKAHRGRQGIRLSQRLRRHTASDGVVKNGRSGYAPMQTTPLPMTKAPTKMRPMDTKKMIVATTRTGLNICASSDTATRYRA
jgi:hypothetical protein